MTLVMRIFTAASKGVGVDFGIGHRGGGAANLLYICFVAACAKLVTNCKNLNAGQIKQESTKS